MKKTKIKQRLENAAHAFFTIEDSSEKNLISFANSSEVFQNEIPTNFSKKVDTYFNIFKQVFLFFPGTFILFMISFAFSMIFTSNPYHATLPPDRLVWVTFWFLSGIVMTWLGIGNMRKAKHFIIPGSIITVGIAVGLVSGILSAGFYEVQKIVWNDSYPFYFFPLALIVPFLAKGWVDRKSEISPD